eukprot:TRINITY_DN8907_c0_g1_i1.p1 TRINITY_DN8907_c0_g1~~TRINITY_DN8907_c0_g1_i1.p1  ORF type:complete len:272 (+),score=87.39 TRINITY_DN8907_c0_g1_i1:34-849(+)
MSDPNNVPFQDDGTTAEESGVCGCIKRRVVGKNWTAILKLLSGIAAGCLIASGISLFSLFTLNVLQTIVGLYLIFLGIVFVGALIPCPESWVKLNYKWVPFLHTFRGRGIFLMFLGSLSVSFGFEAFLACLLGVAVTVVGLLHVILACFFREKLEQAPTKMGVQHNTAQEMNAFDEENNNNQGYYGNQSNYGNGPPPSVPNRPSQAPQPTWQQQMQQAVIQTAWDNRDEIAKTAWDNRQVIADNAGTVAHAAWDNRASISATVQQQQGRPY